MTDADENKELTAKCYNIFFHVLVPHAKQFSKIDSPVFLPHPMYAVNKSVHAAVSKDYEGLHSNFKGTSTCSTHSGTASYETYIAGQEESGCVVTSVVTL